MPGPSADDLAEIASGKGSARDMREAGVSSKKEASVKLRRLRNHMGGVKVHTSIKRRKKRRY